MKGTVHMFLVAYQILAYNSSIYFIIGWALANRKQEGHDGPRVAHLSFPDCGV